MINLDKIGVIGLGYVGLPLAVEFGKKYKTYGFDISKKRVDEIKLFKDSTLEIEESIIKESLNKNLHVTNDLQDIRTCNTYIITVPTPIDSNKSPDLSPLIKSSEMIGSILSENDTVIYESTVYPGLTEEICVPILKEKSGLELNKSFFVGYSPERINPGDKQRTLTKIKKITSGSNEFISKKIDELYASIISAGTYRCPSIKVAEAAKVIENSQRDINIAFVNELSIIFNLLNIDTYEVLKAANTKWNFLPFYPGLVGGHCIGVDPYYLAEKSIKSGYSPEIILSGRRLNDEMGTYISKSVIKLMIKNDIKIKDSNVLILGFTFKENCPDFRNTKVIDIVKELSSYSINVFIHDPYVEIESVKNYYDLIISNNLDFEKKFDAIILAVKHDSFKKIDLNVLKNKNTVIYDIKSFLNPNNITARLW